MLLEVYITRLPCSDGVGVGDGNVCFYGECYYCKRAEAACAAGELMEGSLTLWLPKWYELTVKRHPYQRTYREGKKARLVPALMTARRVVLVI